MDHVVQETGRARVKHSEPASRLQVESVWFGALIALGLLPSSGVQAGVNTLTAIGPEGGAISDIAYHPSNRSIVFAATGAGLYRSTDEGASWQVVPGSTFRPPTRLAVNAVTHRLFAMSNDIRISDDDGATLQLLETFPAPSLYKTQLEISADGSVIYVTGGARIFRSDDDGQSWQERTSMDPTSLDDTNDLVIDPADPDHVFVLHGQEKLYASTDGAQTWTSIPLVDTFPASVVQAIAVTNTTQQTLWAATFSGVWGTRDGGQSWFSTGTTKSVRTIEVDPRDPSTLYVDDSDRILRFNGSFWTSSAEGVHAGTISTIAPSPLRSGLIFIGGTKGIAATRDLGATWTRPNTGILATNIAFLVPVNASNRTYVATQANGAYYLEAGSSQLMALNNEPLDQIWGFFAQRVQQDRVFASGGVSLLRSADGGLSWASYSDPLFFPRNFTSTPSNPNLILATVTTNVYRTTDGGSTWAPASGLPTEPLTEAIALAPSNASIAYVGLRSRTGRIEDGYGIYRSRDSGITWEPANKGIETVHPAALAVDPRDERVVYAGTFSGLMKSADGGDTWTELDWGATSIYGEAYALAIDPGNPDIIYATQSLGRIARSVDAGANWQAIPLPASESWVINALALDGGDSSRLLIGTYSHGLREISIQPDLSLHVSPQTGSLSAGTAATFTYTIGNEGPFDATGVTTKLMLGSSASKITAQSVAGSCNESGGTVSCVHPILRTSQSLAIQVTAVYADADDHTISASIAGEQPDPVTNNNEAAITFKVAAAPTQSGNPPTAGGGSDGGAGGGGGGSSSPGLLIVLGSLAFAARVKFRGRVSASKRPSGAGPRIRGFRRGSNAERPRAS